MNVQRIPHLDGDPGVAQTIRQMRRLIDQGKSDAQIHELAARILTSARVPAFDWQREARAIFDWVQRNIRFTRDVEGHETLHGAADIVRLGIGDCDDFTVLTLSLAGSIGAQGRIVTISTDPSEAREFTHVYPEVEVNGRWISLDAARLHPAFGKSPERYTRKRAWALDSQEYTDMAGLRTSIAPGQGPQGAWRQDVVPAFRVNAAGKPAGGFGSYLSAPPIPPPAQRRKKVPQGFGNYGRAAARKIGLGDWTDDVDWGGISQAIGAGTTGAAQIIRAETQPAPLPGYTYNAAGQLVPLTAATSISTSSLFAGISGNTLLLLGLGGIALLALRN